MNIFSVLDTSDNEEEVVKNVPKKKEQSGAKNDEKKPVKIIPGAPKPPAPKKEDAGKTTAAVVESDPKDGKDDNRGGRPRGKEGSRRGEKYGNNTQEGNRRPKREFERRSGTGRGKELSKGGRGPYGFGNVEQEALEAEKDPSNAEVVNESAEPETAADNETSPAAEPEPATMSYEDFIRKRNEARAASSILSVTASQASVQQNEDKASAAAKKDQRSTNKTQVFDVQFRFESNNNNFREQRTGGRRDNERGGRGRGRGANRGRGSDRKAPAVALNPDEFPSL